MRLDVMLVNRGLAPSRNRAQRWIAQGRVRVDGEKVLKASADVPDDVQTVVEESFDYVGRGGWKMHAALEAFALDPSGCVALDIGASTGGFTQCLLRFGASKVYAVDVGQGQLAEELRADPRVVLMEKTNARYLQPSQFEEVPTVATADVSFISLNLILPALAGCLPQGAWAVVLVKPQFECGPEALNAHGIVAKRADRVRALKEVCTAAAACGFRCCNVIPSPFPGGDGNPECLVHLQRLHPPQMVPPQSWMEKGFYK
nr:TlyA family RNA methyltransferase [bacterium]